MISRRLRRHSTSRISTGSAFSDTAREMFGLELVQSFEGMPDAIYSIAWSPDGMTLAATGKKDAVGIWPASGPELHLLEGHAGGIIGLAWHPARQMIATGSTDGTVRLWDVEAGTSRALCELDSYIRGVAWSPDGSLIGVGDGSGNVGIWNVAENAWTIRSKVHKDGVYRPIWTSDAQTLVTSSVDQTIRVQRSKVYD